MMDDHRQLSMICLGVSVTYEALVTPSGLRGD